MLQKVVPQGFRINLAILLKEKLSDFEIVLAQINPGNEEILNLEKLELTSNTNEDYTQISHYQKSGYSVQIMEHVPRKRVSKKNVADKSLQTDSKVSIFRRKEIMDESEQTNISARTSSAIPLKGFEQDIIFPEETEIKKACVQDGTKQVEKYDSQQIKTQDVNKLDSQHSSKQAVFDQNLPNQTFSQGQPLNKERICTCERSGRMVSSYQQTSIVWGPETLAELLLPFHQSMIKNNSEKEIITFSRTSEIKPVLQEQISERHIVQESCHGIQQSEGQEPGRDSQSADVQDSQYNIRPEEQESRRDSKSIAIQDSQHSIQQPEEQESRRGSQSVAVQESWHGIQKQQGLESKRGSQQATEQEFQDINKKSEGQESKQDIQQPKSEGEKPKRRRKIRKIKIDQTQQTDSAQSLKRELLEKSLQTDTVSAAKIRAQLGMQDSRHSSHQYDLQKTDKPVISELCVDSLPQKQQDFHQGIKPIDIQELCSYSLPASFPDSLQEVQEFRHSSLPFEDRQGHQKRPLAGLKEFEHDGHVHQLTKKDNQSDTLFELKQISQHGSPEAENEIDTMALKQTMSFGQQTYSIISLEENTWLNRRSGKLMQNHSQQTNDSWLQNYREKKQKLASKEYTAFETRRSEEQAAVLEDSKRSPSLEYQRSSKQPISLEIEKASIDEPMILEFEESTEVTATTESQKENEVPTPEFPTPPNTQRSSEETVLPGSERCSEKCMVSDSLKTSEEIEFQTKEPPNIMQLHWTSEQPLASELKTGELFHDKWEANEAMELSNTPHSRRVSAPASMCQSQKSSEPSNLPQARRSSEAPTSQKIPEPGFVCGFQKANLPPVSESYGDNKPLLSSEFEMGSEYPPLLDFRKGSGQPAVVPVSSKCNKQPICLECRKFDEPSLSAFQNSEQPIIPEFQKDRDHPYELESPKHGEPLTVSESQMDSKQPAIPEPQRSTDPLIDSRKDSVKPDVSESRRYGESLIMPKSQRDSEQAIMPESQSVSQQPTTLLRQWESKQPVVVEAEHQLVADKVNKVAEDNILESHINDSEQKPPRISKSQQTYSIISIGINTWQNRKTGKLMTCTSQQTERSWLQEHRPGKVNLTPMGSFARHSTPDVKKTEIDKIHRVDNDRKESIAQQDAGKDESQLEIQMVAAALIKEIETSRQASKQVERVATQQAEDISSQQTGQQQEIMASEQEEGMALQISSKLDVEQERYQGSKQSVKHESHYNDIPWSTPSNEPYETTSRSTLDSTSSYVEGEDEALQTYSRISLENGVWLNRKTGKVLISQSQQTSISLLGKRALENSGNSADGPKPPISDVKLNESKFDQQACSSNRSSVTTVSSPSIEQSWDEMQSIDEVEKVLVSHISRDIVSRQSLAYIEMEYEPALTYDSLSMPKGSWLNLKTGKVLVSRYQQTDESCIQKLKEGIQPNRHPSYTPELSYYDLSNTPVKEGLQQTCSDAYTESGMPDG